MAREYAVMWGQYPDETHRGPWTEAEVDEWIASAEDDGFREGAFYKVSREVSEWANA